MIVKIGNIFDSKCSTIVNTVNCVGVMGKGLALDFKNKYPEMYLDYVSRCKKGQVKPGIPYLYSDKDVNMINFPTKDHWRSFSKLSYVVSGLNWFVSNYEKYAINSIAFPALGCGNGGLSWDIVGPIMYDKLHNLPIEVEVYAPYGTSKEKLEINFLSNLNNQDKQINPKWYLILLTIRRLNERKYSLKVGRVIYQKICYVLTRSGINTGFVFSKGTYGPFSSQVKDSISTLSNANLIIEKQLNKMICINVSDNVKIDESKFTDEELKIVNKTVDLFSRIKNSEQAEMVATVLYSYDQLSKEKKEVLDKNVFDYVLDWKPHFKIAKEFELTDTIANMAMLSFINVKYSGELEDTSLV